MPESKRQPSSASAVLQLGTSHVDRDALKERLRERDQREASDTRSEIEKLLGVPPRSQSALALLESLAKIRR